MLIIANLIGPNALVISYAVNYNCLLSLDYISCTNLLSLKALGDANLLFISNCQSAEHNGERVVLRIQTLDKHTVRRLAIEEIANEECS